jgi:hypothetical protein
MVVLSGVLGVALLAVGSNSVIPIGVGIGSVVSLLGVASMILAFGLADGD